MREMFCSTRLGVKFMAGTLLCLTLSACGIKGALYYPPPVPLAPSASSDHSKAPAAAAVPLPAPAAQSTPKAQQ